MPRSKARLADRDAEPKDAREAVDWWRKRVLEQWRRGEVAIVRRRMAAVLGLAAAASEWRATHKFDGGVEYD